MCREGYFLFLKKKSGQASFSTEQVIFFFTCPVGKWNFFLICQPLNEVIFHIFEELYIIIIDTCLHRCAG